MTDTKNDLICPACGSKMAKVFAKDEGINLDICLDGCGGIYFDNREIEHFDEKEEDISLILDSLEGKKFKPVNQSELRICPSCGAKMVKNFASVKRKFQIDECYSCGGKFLDNSELQAMRDEYNSLEEKSQDAVKFLYDAVGSELLVHQKEAEEARRRRSPVKKLFDYIITGRYQS